MNCARKEQVATSRRRHRGVVEGVLAESMSAGSSGGSCLVKTDRQIELMPARREAPRSRCRLPCSMTGFAGAVVTFSLLAGVSTE